MRRWPRSRSLCSFWPRGRIVRRGFTGRPASSCATTTSAGASRRRGGHVDASGEHDAESCAEGGEVQAVNDAVAVEVEVWPVVGVPIGGTECRPERGQVQGVNRLVAVNVTEEAEQAR